MHSGEWDLPDPPGVHPVKGSHWWRWVSIAIVLIGLAAAAFWVQIPFFYAYLPGPVRNVDELIDVSGADTYSSEGELLMTTVSVDLEVTFADWVEASFDPHSVVVDRDAVTGGQSFSDLEKQQLDAMDQSKQHAQEVALSALGLAQPESDGVRVVEVIEGVPAAEAIRPGDVIVKVDGDKVQTSCEVGSAIGQREPGSRIQVTVRRDGRLQTFEVGTVADPQDPSSSIIGVSLEDINYRFDPGVKVEFESGEIAGPSAGLMFTLALYDRLTPEDLTSGKKIAGTGTIACDGQVGPIGGIEQKIAGAEEA
ncbi:MAG: Lon-like protease, partial [Actinomycetota bacterium]|nr:Lon-like protease [Actinomycetota bacterium]